MAEVAPVMLAAMGRAQERCSSTIAGNALPLLGTPRVLRLRNLVKTRTR